MFTPRSRPVLSVAAAVTSAAALTGILSGCGGTSPASGATSASPAVTAPPGASSASPGAASASAARPAASSCADRAFSGLTEAQRVGQLFLVGMAADRAGPATAAAERRYHFGSVLFAGNTYASSRTIAATTSYVQSLATASATGGVRFFVAANQEGGQVRNLKGFPAMPAALTQGSWSVSQLRQRAAAWGRALKSAGVNLDLAPVMDVVPAGTAAGNAPIGQLGREFGSTAAGNGAHGAAFIRGMASVGVATAAKHFPGLGRVTGNTDFTAHVVDSVTAPGDPDLATYASAAAARVPFMMVALATYTKIDASRLAVFSPAVMRLLRSSTGFGGVIVSDDLGDAAAVASVPAGQRAVRFLSAGGDMITSQSLRPAEEMASAVLSQASADPAFRATVDSAVKKILAAKQSYGLLPC
ncbi:MAG: glycoside hydrolase family 3 protein [Nocardiopsaceae bacterium]|nr:glycoside hydrolase family 3 protein [Nocardiopsaceae bacterium]